MQKFHPSVGYFPLVYETVLSYKRPIKKHNSARMVILYAIGIGIYLDHDYVQLKRIEPALGRCKVYSKHREHHPKHYGSNQRTNGWRCKASIFLIALRMMMNI